MAQMLLFLLASLLPAPTFAISTASIRIGLTRVDSELNLTKSELLHRAIQRTKHRIARLTSVSSTDIQAPVKYSVGSYQMAFVIGTPPLPTTVIMDTGSDLIWTQCTGCAKTKCFNQTTQVFDPSNSTTFAKIACDTPLCGALDRPSCTPDCRYVSSYGDGTSTMGVLATETFTFGSESPVTVPGIGFGCSDDTTGDVSPAAGIVGLGRGKLSLVSQLGSAKFSYCLTSFGVSSPSPLLLGSLAVLNGAVKSTPLIQNPVIPSLYYLSLQGITVGSTRLPISSTVFALATDGSGGMVIDSGTTLTYLRLEAYQVLKQEFQSQVNLSVANASGTGFDLCFSLPAEGTSTVEVPELVFHFDGADMAFPTTNYLAGLSGRGLVCLAIVPSRRISILGDTLQQNMHILYDLSAEKLSFVQAQCDRLRSL